MTDLLETRRQDVLKEAPEELERIEFHGPPAPKSGLLLWEGPDAWMRLHRNRAVPWLIVVPKTEVAEFLDLEPEERRRLLAICAGAARTVRSESTITKLNIASLGNEVPQMHLHVIGRHAGDPGWPRPVWGHLAWDRDTCPWKSTGFEPHSPPRSPEVALSWSQSPRPKPGRESS